MWWNDEMKRDNPSTPVVPVEPSIASQRLAEMAAIDTHKVGYCLRFASGETCVGCGDVVNGDACVLLPEVLDLGKALTALYLEVEPSIANDVRDAAIKALKAVADQSHTTLTPVPVVSREPLKIRYTNYKGETAARSIIPDRVYFGSTQWHPEPQWLLEAFDVDKNEIRTFAFKGIAEVSREPLATCPECRAKSQLTLTATGPWINIVCGACKQWWSVGEIEHTPYFFGGKAASNGPNKVATCSVEGCTNPSRWQSKCDFHLNVSREPISAEQWLKTYVHGTPFAGLWQFTLTEAEIIKMLEAYAHSLTTQGEEEK